MRSLTNELRSLGFIPGAAGSQRKFVFVKYLFYIGVELIYDAVLVGKMATWSDTRLLAESKLDRDES